MHTQTHSYEIKILNTAAFLSTSCPYRLQHDLIWSSMVVDKKIILGVFKSHANDKLIFETGARWAESYKYQEMTTNMKELKLRNENVNLEEACSLFDNSVRAHPKYPPDCSSEQKRGSPVQVLHAVSETSISLVMVIT